MNIHALGAAWLINRGTRFCLLPQDHRNVDPGSKLHQPTRPSISSPEESVRHILIGFYTTPAARANISAAEDIRRTFFHTVWYTRNESLYRLNNEIPHLQFFLNTLTLTIRKDLELAASYYRLVHLAQEARKQNCQIFLAWMQIRQFLEYQNILQSVWKLLDLTSIQKNPRILWTMNQLQYSGSAADIQISYCTPLPDVNGYTIT